MGNNNIYMVVGIDGSFFAAEDGFVEVWTEQGHDESEADGHPADDEHVTHQVSIPQLIQLWKQVHGEIPLLAKETSEDLTCEGCGCNCIK